jgi:hypothetical protein
MCSQEVELFLFYFFDPTLTHFERFRVYLTQMELYKQFINACILQPFFESLNVPSPPHVPNLVAHNFFLGC